MILLAATALTGMVIQKSIFVPEMYLTHVAKQACCYTLDTVTRILHYCMRVACE